MTPERWRQIGDLFDAAVRIDPAGREAWLRAACGGDDDLRAEVGRLLAQDERADRDGLLTPPGETLADIPRVHLRDTEPFTGPGPVVRPSSAEMPDPADRLAGSSCSARSPAAAWAPSSRAATPTSAATWPSRSCSSSTATSPSWSAGSSRRPRSAASSSTRASCRSTSWAPSPTAGRTSR